MIPIPNNFTVSNGDIITTADRLGYDRYLPLDVIRDFAYLRIHSILGTNLTILRPNSYTSGLLELMDMINSDAIETNNSVEFAVNVLKLISPRVNLRELESSRVTKMPILIDYEFKQMNYRDDISLINPEYMELLGVDTSQPTNEIVLSEEVQDIIHFYNGITKISGELHPQTISYICPLTNLRQVGKVRKYRFGLPSFITDLALKKLFVRDSEVVMTQNNNAVVLIDVSWSTTINPKYFSIVKAVLLTLLDTFVDGVTSITILEFHSAPSRELVLSTKEEVKQYINHKPTPVIGPSGWKNVCQYIKKFRFRDESIILITDGKLNVSWIPDGLKLYAVSTGNNTSLGATCINSGGKLVLV